MKKSSAVLIIVFLVFFVFIFENLRSLMIRLETSELESVKLRLKAEAKYLLLKYNGDINFIKEQSDFKEVYQVSEIASEGDGENRKGERIFFFYLNLGENRFFRFERELLSPALTTVHRVGGIVSSLTLLLGILIVIMGIYLVVISRKKKEVKDNIEVPLLQDYLMKLENSKTLLKETVEKQKVDVVRTDEINRTIINNIGAAIVFVNDNNKIDIFNSHAEKIFKIKFVSAKNSDLKSVFKNFPEIYTLIESTKLESVISEITMGKKYFLVEVTPIRAGGKIVIARDISERKQRESLMNRKRNFETLGEMTLFLTHEIRNSLGVIYGYTKTFGENNSKTKKINREIEFLTGMMESFLNFSKPVVQKNRDTVNIPKLLDKIGKDYGITVKIECPGSNEEIKTDADLISSVFSNLVKNSKESGADKIEVKIRKSNLNETEILFSDNGKGIKKEVRDKIWLPFFTSRDKGTGMGLAIVKKIVYSLNGEILLTETGKSGTTFSISLYSEEQM